MSKIDAAFFDKAFRERWLDEQIRVGLATQIREMRLDRGWTQAELARRCGMSQERISQIENPHWRHLPTITSLKRIAAAVDAALIIRFGPWSLLLTGRGFDWMAPVPSFEEEFRAPSPGAAAEEL